MTARSSTRAAALAVIATVLAPVALAAPAAIASAAVQSFTVQLAPAALPEGASLSLDGDQVTGFSAQVRPTACQSPADWQTDSDDVFTLSLPASAGVTLAGGAFSYTGTASSADYGAGSATAPYGGQFTISGTVNQSHTFATATVTLSGAGDPFVSGCSGTYTVIAIPTVTATTASPDRSAYRSQFVSFDYATGVVRRLQVQANFDCGPSIDEATINAARYGYPSLQTTARGAFHVTLYALDEYGHIVAVTITGRVGHGRASGRVTVAEPAPGFTGVAGDACSGSRGWTAARSSGAPGSAPAAYFQWAAIRVPDGAAYRYYFAVNQLTCIAHATELRVTVIGQSMVIPCSRSAAFASGPLAPSATYRVTSQALARAHGRVVARGPAVTVPLRMPDPGDLWTVLSGLPGTPPG